MKFQLPALSFQLSGKSRCVSYPLKAQSSKLKAGFTLIELLVVVGIIVVISAVILANTNKFGGQTLLQNLAYDIALSVREAQVYGISVQENNGSFEEGYGMHFSMNTPTTYNLFADAAHTGVYVAGEDVKPSPYTIGQSFQISKLCVTPANSAEECTGSSPSITSLDILFIRPEPDACISVNGAADVVADPDGSESCSASDTNQSARVVITSPRGGFMNVIVYANGQISVENDPTGI